MNARALARSKVFMPRSKKAHWWISEACDTSESTQRHRNGTRDLFETNVQRMFGMFRRKDCEEVKRTSERPKRTTAYVYMPVYIKKTIKHAPIKYAYLKVNGDRTAFTRSVDHLYILH